MVCFPMGFIWYVIATEKERQNETTDKERERDRQPLRETDGYLERDGGKTDGHRGRKTKDSHRTAEG